jgi:protein-tyrosine kinase
MIRYSNFGDEAMGRMFDALQKVEFEKNQEPAEDSPKASPEDVILDSKLVSFFEPSSMVAEQFRKLRTHIIKPGQNNFPKTILITSAMAGEGKSLVAINLAITIANEMNSNALVVDCDLQEGKGLSNYLQGEAELPDLIVKTSVDKLSIIGGGKLPDNPVELVGSNKMKNLVAELKSRYDDRFILLDSSPLLATTEPNVLNDMVDGIIIVVRSGYTPRESVLQAMNLLDKKKILGIVLNDLEFKTEALVRRYFGTNRYYYDYRYSKKHPEPSHWGKIAAMTKDAKALVGKLRRKKE